MLTKFAKQCCSLGGLWAMSILCGKVGNCSTDWGQRCSSNSHLCGIVTALWTERSTFWFPARAKGVAFLQNFQPVSGPTKLPLQCVLWLCFPAINWLGCEFDHSPRSSAKVRSEWSCTSAPTICLYGIDRNYLYLRAVIPNLQCVWS
jgi:hypothetical protein